MQYRIVPNPKPYAEILTLQMEYLARLRADPAAEDVVIFCEHLPTITLGRRTDPGHLISSASELAAAGIPIHRITRGGSATAHEPGQLVVYPILRLDRYGLRVSEYVSQLAAWLAAVCQKFGVPAHAICDPHNPNVGVWVHDRKIASIGIGVESGIVFHGVALNVNNDGATFAHIAPCGMSHVRMTSLARESGKQVATEDVVSLAKVLFEGFVILAKPKYTMESAK